jgi:RimJ/RimL family protein N-acetyltransferase
MSSRTVLDNLETDRLILRRRRVEDAWIYRYLWTERDPRVPDRRKIDADGRPSVEDVAAWIRAERDNPAPGVLGVTRRDTGDVIGYCGLVFHGNGAPDEPELAFELLRSAHGAGYATEAAAAVVAWADAVGYDRLWATVRDWNLPSRRVLEKLGFQETGEVEIDPIHGDSLLTVRHRASGRLRPPGG